MQSITCPCCESKIKGFITKNYKSFCPNCHKQVWRVNYVNQFRITTKKALLKQLLKALAQSAIVTLFFVPAWMALDYVGFSDWQSKHPFMFFILLVAVIITVFFIDKLLSKDKPQVTYQCGVDTLEDFENDKTEYKPVGCCPECKSKRMVDLFWYKRRLLETKKSLAKIELDEKDFVGCLKCHAQYKILPKKMDYTDFYMFLFLIAFGATLFLSYQHIVKIYI